MRKPPDFEFFYDGSNPWTYLAFTRVLPIVEQLGVPVRWRPILVGGVFNAINPQLYAANRASAAAIDVRVTQASFHS